MRNNFPDCRRTALIILLHQKIAEDDQQCKHITAVVCRPILQTGMRRCTHRRHQRNGIGASVCIQTVVVRTDIAEILHQIEHPAQGSLTQIGKLCGDRLPDIRLTAPQKPEQRSDGQRFEQDPQRYIAVPLSVMADIDRLICAVGGIIKLADQAVDFCDIRKASSSPSPRESP